MKLCDVTECPSPLACDAKDYTQALQDYTQALTNDRGWLRDSAEKRTLDEQHPMPTEDRSRRLALALAAIQKAVRPAGTEDGAQVAGSRVGRLPSSHKSR